MNAWNKKSKDEIADIAKIVPPGLSGVEQSEEMLQWIWENFSAVAGDHPSFECWRKFLRCSYLDLARGLISVLTLT
jgi:hypothetical protein